MALHAPEDVVEHAHRIDDMWPPTFGSGGMLYLAVSSEVSDTTSVFSISAVPEPSAWALMAGGLALIGWRSRSRRRQA